MKAFLIFISYKYGNHYNCLCHSAEETHQYLINELDEMWKDNDKTPPTLEQIQAINEDLFILLEDSSWITITAVTDYSEKQIIKYADLFRKGIYRDPH